MLNACLVVVIVMYATFLTSAIITQKRKIKMVFAQTDNKGRSCILEIPVLHFMENFPWKSFHVISVEAFPWCRGRRLVDKLKAVFENISVAFVHTQIPTHR